MVLKEVIDGLREKRDRGVKQVRVTTVLDELERAFADVQSAAVEDALGTVDLVGTREVSEILGVEPSRIGRWMNVHRQSGRSVPIPMPDWELASGPVWVRAKIEAAIPEVEARRRRRED